MVEIQIARIRNVKRSDLFISVFCYFGVTQEMRFYACYLIHDLKQYICKIQYQVQIEFMYAYTFL